ncbi:MAG: hypothetical protein METHAR1v1_400011, partial [Methanothrix sp.]
MLLRHGEGGGEDASVGCRHKEVLGGGEPLDSAELRREGDLDLMTGG